MVKSIIESIETYGDAKPPKSGIRVQPLSRNIARALDFRGIWGVVISDVEDSSPGSAAGFQKGDILTEINEFPVSSTEEAGRIFRGAYPGEKFQMRVYREGVYHDLELELIREDKE